MSTKSSANNHMCIAHQNGEAYVSYALCTVYMHVEGSALEDSDTSFDMSRTSLTVSSISRALLHVVVSILCTVIQKQ